MIYERKSIRESIHEDILNHDCIFDEKAFARHYDIDGHAVLGIMVRSRTSREYNPETGILGRSGMLFMCRCSDVKNVQVNNVLRIDGKAYYVTEARRVQNQYWKIELSVNE